MIHVVLDTNVLRSHFTSRTKGFDALTSLGKSGLIQLHIPYIVEKEYISQLSKQEKDKFDNASSSLNSLKRSHFVSRTNESFFKETISKLSKLEKSAVSNIEQKFASWIKTSKAIVHNIKTNHAERVFEKYFKGVKPFSQLKNRSDIPDAFIYEVIKDISQSEKDIHVICNDKNLRESFSNDANITTYESLDHFIKASSCQDLLLEQKVSTHIADIIIDLKENENKIKTVINNEYIDILAGKTFKDDYIPEDNNEATIQMIDEIDNLEFSFDEVIYYGSATLGIPFILTTEAECYYCIFIGDYYCLPSSRAEHVYIEDWNEHYYMATETFSLAVNGILTVNLDLKNIRNDGPRDKYVKYETAAIDEITDIAIPGSEEY
jgi:rRNA-processing protein FCF1